MGPQPSPVLVVVVVMTAASDGGGSTFDSHNGGISSDGGNTKVHTGYWDLYWRLPDGVVIRRALYRLFVSSRHEKGMDDT